MVKIDNVQKPIFKDGKTFSSGRVTLSNSVDVWFSEIHPIKTLEEALEVANIIIKSLNQI